MSFLVAFEPLVTHYTNQATLNNPGLVRVQHLVMKWLELDTIYAYFRSGCPCGMLHFHEVQQPVKIGTSKVNFIGVEGS